MCLEKGKCLGTQQGFRETEVTNDADAYRLESLHVKDNKVTFGGDENVLYSHCGGVIQLICQKSSNCTLKSIYCMHTSINLI